VTALKSDEVQEEKSLVATALKSDEVKEESSPESEAESKAGLGLKDLLSGENWRGVDATAITGAVQGSSSFAAYEASRQYLPVALNAVLGPTASTAFAESITLASAACAVLLAVFCCAPFEAARVRSIVGAMDPEHRRGLIYELQSIVKEGGIGKLWASGPALLSRELPFVGTKLVVYGQAQAQLFALVPAARERQELALIVALASGFSAGAVAAIVSQPSDTITTQLLAGKDLDKLLKKPPRELAEALFAGTGERATQFGVILMVQFLLFDYCRFLLKVAPEDLSLVLDVFADRLSFYEIS
jgi:hypothetical protein